MDVQLRALAQRGMLIRPFGDTRGSEAATVGAACMLAEGDIIAPQWHDLGAFLAWGVTPREIFAAWMARGEGLATGRDSILGDMRARLIVPSASAPPHMLALAAGTALGTQLRREQRVALAYMHAADVAHGDCYETMAFAAQRRLPLVCVAICADDRYDDAHVHAIHDQWMTWGVGAGIADGTDVLAVSASVQTAVDRARRGGGPAIIAAQIARPTQPKDDEHEAQEDDAGWQRDPVERFARLLLEGGLLTVEQCMQIEDEIMSEIADALHAVEALPPADPATLREGLYASASANLMGPLPTAVVSGTAEGPDRSVTPIDPIIPDAERVPAFVTSDVLSEHEGGEA